MPAEPARRLSRLESALGRARAQRAAIDWAAARIAGVPGDALEVGLGNGRTYDHLRERLPERRIWVIERQPSPHPGCEPPDALLLEGDAADGLARLAGANLALVHVDLGRPGRAARYAGALAAALSPKGGVLISTDPLAAPGLRPLADDALTLSGEERALIHLYERAA